MNAPTALIKVEVETSSPPKRKLSRKAQLTHVHRRRDEELSKTRIQQTKRWR